MVDCTLYAQDRLTLIGHVAQIIPEFNTFSKKRKLEVLLNGYNTNNPDYDHINISLQYHVQNFVLKTKRFTPA